MESSDYSKPDNDDSSIDSLMNLLSDSQPSNSIDLRHRLARRIEQLSQNALQSTILQQAFPLIIQLLHPNHELTDESVSQTLDIRRTAQKSLQRIISLSGCRRQKRVFESLDQICTFCDVVYESEANSNHHSVGNSSVSKLQHPLQPMCSLMKLSFDETYRSIIWQLGGVQSITELFICDNRLHSNQTVSSVNLEQRKECVCLRRYVCMALTNLTFGDRCCKSVVCNQFNFLSALLQQLPGTNDELLQVIASLIRNLSWRPTRAIRVQLQQANVAGLLMKAIIRSSVDKLQEQTTVKCVLLALWNLSSTCPASCRSICQVAGSLRYLIQLLRCECTHGQPSSSSTSLTITNGSNATVAVNAAALLRNLATVVVTQRRWRSELRSDGGLTILLRLLRATSLSMVAAVLGILWPLSSCSLEARYLRQSGAIHMLRGLIWSKHAQIAAAARATLCNLLLNRCVEQETLNPPANSNRPEGSQRIEGELMKLHSDEIQDNLNRNLAFDSKHDRLRSPQLNQSNPVSIRMLRSMSSDLPKNPSDSFVIPMSVNQDDAQQRSQNSVLSASLISLSSYERNQTMIKAPSLPYDNAEALDGRQASKMSQSVMMSTNVLGQSDGGWWSSACLDTHWSNSEPVLGNQVICDHSRRIWRNIQRMQMDSIHMNDHDERDEEEESQEVDESFSINDGDSNLQCFNALDNLLNQNHSNDLKLLRMPFPSDAMQGQTDEKQSSFGLDHPIEYELRKDALFTTIGPEQTVFRAYPVIIGNSCDKLNAIDQSVNSSFVIDAIGTDQSSVGHVVINNEQASEDEQSIEQLLGVSALDVTVLSACLRDNDSLPKVPAETEQTQAQLNKKISKSFEKSLLKLNKTQSNDISAQSKPDANQFSQLFERDHPIRLIQRTTSLFSIHCFAVHNYIFKSKSLPKLISLFDSNEEGDRDETEADIRLQDLTYELVRRPEVDPQATYTLLPSPLIEDHTIVDSSATLVGPAYVGDEFNKTNPGRSRILLNEFDEDEDDENTFRNVDLEPLEDAGISLRGDQDDDPTTFDLLDGSEMSTSISYVDNIQPPSIMQQLDISLQSDSGVSLIGSSRPDSGSTGQVRSRIPRFKSRLPKPKSNATVQSINQNHSSDDFNFRASNIVSTSSSSSTSTLTRKTGSANRSMILDRIDSPPNSPYSDLSGSDACQTPTGDTFTIRRGSMPEYSASCTPLEHVHPPSAMDALSAMSSTYGSINSICSDMCDSLGSCSDMPDSIGGTPPPPSPVTTRSIHAPTINSGTVRRATIARPVQRPPPLNNSSTNTRTQITNGFQTYRKSSATRTSTNSTPGTISSCRDPNQSSTLPRPVSSNMIISAVRSTSSGNMNPSSAMTMTGSSTLVRRRTTSSSAGAHRNQSNASVNENKPPLRTRPTQSKSAGEISSMHQNGINGSCNKSVTTIRKPQSKIASLWKRTVSVQQQQQTSPATKSVVKKPASPAIGKLTSKSTTNRPSTNGSTRTDDSSASTQSSGALVRSGTFEKLPVTDDEAARIGTSTGNKSKVRPFDGSRKTPCRQF